MIYPWTGAPAPGARDIVRITAAGDLDVGDLLTDAVLISLLTWRRAVDSDPVPDGASRQGWWADPTLGSRLWTLRHRGLNAETARAAQGFAADALAWLVTDGLATAVDVDAEVQAGALAMSVEVTRPDQSTLAIRFTDLLGAL